MASWLSVMKNKKLINPSTRKYARDFLEYGENKEGHWNHDRVMEQIKRAVDIAEIKCPKRNGWHHVWVCDHRIDTTRMVEDDTRKALAEMEDFKNEKYLIEHFLISKGHIPVFLPKFHPELNPIERVWVQLKS